MAKIEKEALNLEIIKTMKRMGDKMATIQNIGKQIGSSLAALVFVSVLFGGAGNSKPPSKRPAAKSGKDGTPHSRDGKRGEDGKNGLKGQDGGKGGNSKYGRGGDGGKGGNGLVGGGKGGDGGDAE